MCFCTPDIRTPYCNSAACAEELARVKALKGLRFEFGDEVIIKRHGAVISEGRVQEEIGVAGRTAAVVKFEDGRWAEIAASNGKELSKQTIADLIRLCVDKGDTRAQVLLKRLADLL